MPNTKCDVTGCSSLHPTVKLFRLPRNAERRAKWMQHLLPHNPSLGSLTTNQLINRQVCQLHFEDKYLAHDRRLPYGCPTLFTAEEISSRQPKKPVLSIDDHSYAMLKPDNAATDDANVVRRVIWVNHDHSYCPSCGPHNITKNVIDEMECTVPDISSSLPSINPSAAGTTESYSVMEAPSTAAKLSGVMPTTSTRPETPISHNPPNTRGYSVMEAPSTAAKPSGVMPTTSTRPETPISHNPSNTRGRKSSLITKHRNKCRERIVKSVENLTPRCRKMYFKCREIISSKKRLLFSYEERLQKASEMSKNDIFQEMIRNLTPQAKSFLMMQVRLANKDVKQRRYTTQEKIDALIRLKQSPKSYGLLRDMFILPTRRTLNTFSQKMKLKPGLNENLLRQLKKLVTPWDDKKRLCSIVFDEIAISPQLTFVESNDRIDGFVDFGQQTDKRLCDHALVFMVRGILGSWRQSFAYYLCEGTTPTLQLKKILKEVVDAIINIGLKPKALVCDQGSTFRACLNNFKDDLRRSREQLRLSDHQILINGHVLNIISHLR